MPLILQQIAKCSGDVKMLWHYPGHREWNLCFHTPIPQSAPPFSSTLLINRHPRHSSLLRDVTAVLNSSGHCASINILQVSASALPCLKQAFM
jgi:hypothetical protein